MSASPRVFVTGTSGYFDGHLVGRIVEKHPEWHLVVLVRNEEQKNTILARCPQLEVVGGDLGDSALMIKEGSKADVVLREYLMDNLSSSLPELSRRNWICRPYSGCAISHSGPK
jgi:N-acetyl-gamma-glutamylphosphate reductase